MRIALVFAALTFGLFLAGCSKNPPIVGSWQTEADLQGHAGTSFITFGEEGSFISKSVFQGASGKSITIISRGSWKYEEPNKLITHTDDIDWQLDDSNPRADYARKALLEGKAKAIERANAHPDDLLTWNGADEYSSVDANAQKHIYRRSTK